MKVRNLQLLLIALFLALPSMAQRPTLTTNNAQTHYKNFKEYFVDDICTELKVPYSAMTDDELLEVMSDIPEELANVALKVKNNTWEKREKEFRVFEAKPYSNSYNWKYMMNVRQYSELQNPTGISADNEFLLIFVGSELPDSIWMELSTVAGNMPRPLVTNVLQSGLNVVKIPDTEGDDRMLFIQYYVDTDSSATSKKLADYPNVPIHIEGGYVNGYFDLARHTDEDWRDMTKNMMKHYSVQVLGERVMFQMKLENVLAACPNTITDAIKWWDECVKWQHELMGADKYYDRWNDLIMAKDGYEGMFMYATETYTYYEYYTLPDILPWKKVYADPGQMWGPAHEIGHVNQNAINIVSCTEATNNLFANVQIFRTGKTTTRGNGVSVCSEDFCNRTPFPLRGSDIIAKSRMFFQLYLYFHAAGKDTTFWPRVFEALRKNPLDKGPKDRNWTSLTQAKDDQLKFAEVCCEVAQMDLSEFFEAWGIFEPMTDAWIGDYDNFIVNLTKEEAEASRARMQKYEKKGGHLIFIEDRIKPSKREDGVNGNRLDFNEDFAIGKMGDVGQWSDYIDESVKAQGYYYTLKNDYVKIAVADGAKGALGFKLYDANTGELLSFSNTYNLNIPAFALGREYRVVAAQADGTDCELFDMAESDDKVMLKEALNALLSRVMVYTLRQTSDGTNIGYYYNDVVADITTLYYDAKKAVKGDLSLEECKDWIARINDAVKAIEENPNAYALIQESASYQIRNNYTKSYMCNDVAGVKTIDNLNYAEDRNKVRWVVESAGESGCYYIKDRNGFYINDIATNGAYCNGKGKDDALLFEIVYNSKNNGTLSFISKSNNLYLSANDDGVVMGVEQQNENSMWLVTVDERTITSVEVVKDDVRDDVFFDLQGRKVTTPGKGIYIKNGEKVVMP